MEKEYKVQSKVSLETLSIIIRDFYLSRGYTDNRYLDSFEKWYISKIEQVVDNLENCFLKTMFISTTILELRYEKLKIYFLISIFFNLSAIYLLFFKG